MTMVLAIMTMVLVGVMGAGLLTFVVTDLGAVVEANQGERAFEMADAGMRTAELQLTSDSDSSHYDGGSNDIGGPAAEAV
jgi:Tfp pilus assembly protein PilX